MISGLLVGLALATLVAAPVAAGLIAAKPSKRPLTPEETAICEDLAYRLSLVGQGGEMTEWVRATWKVAAFAGTPEDLDRLAEELDRLAKRIAEGETGC